MLQFERYPIFIVHSLHRQQSVDPIWRESFAERQAAKTRAREDLSRLRFGRVVRDVEVYFEKDRKIDATIEWQIMDDLPKYSKESEIFQSKMMSTLKTISHTSLGKALLDMISTKQKVYIIPQETDGPATTRLVSDDQGGGIRIMLSPQFFSNVAIAPSSAGKRSYGSMVEDALFHELVHAMRISTERYRVRTLSSWDFRHSSEEFVAETFANIYHSSRRESDFYGTYQGSFLTKKEMYKYLEGDIELVRALRFFFNSEPLAKTAAGLFQPAYNPFRDILEIEEKSYVKFFTDDESNPFKDG